MDERPSSLVRLLADERFRAWVNQPTPELEHYWKQRLRQYPEERATVAQARRVLSQLDFKKSKHIDREGILAKAVQRADSSRTTAAATRRYPRWYWAAAALAGLMIAASYWLIPLGVQTVETAYGESRTVVLPDSSTVVLNANSTLSFANDWDKARPRQVTLAGEAFFSVTHQANEQKFIVRTDGLAIEVLGTEFNVNHRRGETKVVLERGSIRLDWPTNQSTKAAGPDTAQSLMVQPGELALFSEAHGKATKKIVNPQLYSAWKDQRWLFEQTPLSEVFAMIEDNYGYRVTTEPPTIADEVFTAEIAPANLELLLTFLSESFNLEITKDSSVIIIREKSSRP